MGGGAAAAATFRNHFPSENWVFVLLHSAEGWFVVFTYLTALFRSAMHCSEASWAFSCVLQLFLYAHLTDLCVLPDGTSWRNLQPQRAIKVKGRLVGISETTRRFIDLNKLFSVEQISVSQGCAPCVRIIYAYPGSNVACVNVVRWSYLN